MVVVGVDAATEAVCRYVADMYGLRLRKFRPQSLFWLLERDWQKLVGLVLDDSIERPKEVLSALSRRFRHLPVIVVTSNPAWQNAAEVIRRGAVTAILKPCTFELLNKYCGPIIIAKDQTQEDSKIRRPRAEEFPIYCDRCQRELLHSEHHDRRESPFGDRPLTLEELERRTICATVARVKGDNLKAARILGIGKTTLYRKLKQYGFGRVSAAKPSGSADQLTQIAVLKKQAESVLVRMRELERRLSGRT